MKVLTESVQFTYGHLQKVKESVLKRFYLALLLFQLWSGMSIWEASEMFRIHRGFTQQALSSASAFASCVFHFCQVNWLKQLLLLSFCCDLWYAKVWNFKPYCIKKTFIEDWCLWMYDRFLLLTLYSSFS